MALDQARVEYYLQVARAISKVRPLYDMHVSPYEVIFCQYEYQPNAEHAGVYSINPQPYRPPKTSVIKLEKSTHRHDKSPQVPSKFSLMMYKRYYAHIGPRVFADHMKLSGINRNLFIPVVQPDCDGREQFRLMFDLYQDDERFYFAYCPPKSVAAKDLLRNIQSVVAQYQVKAIKINPNIQEVDLSLPAGQEWAKHLFYACQALKLPLMIHGGISTVTSRDCACGFATIDNLLPLPWCDIKVPVVLSHAGLFGSRSSELDILMPKLLCILENNSNVLVDISGLHFDILCAVLEQIDHDRIVFGSDALYFPQWSAVAKVLHALDITSNKAEESFVQIAGTNPEKLLLTVP